MIGVVGKIQLPIVVVGKRKLPIVNILLKYSGNTRRWFI
jgi:hypothetical protein